MSKYPLVIDVSTYQPNTVSYYRKMKQLGVKAVIIKVTEGSALGTNYVNPYAKAQRQSAKQAGLRTHAYHFAQMKGKQDSINEAKFFYAKAKALGFDVENDAMLLDIESANVNSSPATNDCNAFVDYLKGKGCKLTGTYSMASWFTSGRINKNALHSNILWVASYGSASAGVSGVDVWQYSDTFSGYSQDINYDITGKLTGKAKDYKPEYFKFNPRLVSITSNSIGLYKDKNFKKLDRRFPRGTQFTIKGLAKTTKGTPVLEVQTAKGSEARYISANRDYVKNMYYIKSNIGSVELLHKAYLYHDVDSTKRLRAYPKGTVFQIKNIVKSKSGLWKLHTTSGFYLTANKNYVKKA